MASLAGSYIDVLAIPFTQRGSLVPVNWTLVEDIRREGDANNTVCTALRIFTQTMFRGGFSIEVVRAGHAEIVDPWFLEHVVACEWMPAIEKMLKHFFYFGFACVVYVQSAQGAVVPRVLDVNEYTLYFRREEDGGRSYVVYSQPATPYASGGTPFPVPIPNARLLFVGEGPDASGAPTSRLRDVLPSLLVASELWENVRAADYDRTHPAYIYEKPTTGSGGVTGAIISASTRTFNTADNDARVHDTMLEHEENAEARLEAESAIAAARAYNRTPQRRLVDKSSGGIVYAQAPLPWEKHKSVPVGARLAAPPVPQMLPFFADAYRILRTHVCQAFGVPGELLGDGGVGSGDSVAASSETTSGMLRDSVISMQQRVGPHIATLYMDVFRDKYMGEFEDTVIDVHRATGRIMSADDLAQLRPRFFVRVTFLNTPALRYDDVMALREARVIGRETAQQLALGVFNLPPDMALSRADEERERRYEAEREAEAAHMLAEATAPEGAAKPKPKAAQKAPAPKRARNE